MVMALILLFMAIETQIWNSDGGALTSPPALLFISYEKKRWLVAESSQSNSEVLVEPGDTSLVQISPIRLPPGPSVLIGPQCPGWGQFVIGGDSGDRVTLTTVLVTCQTPASPLNCTAASFPTALDTVGQILIIPLLSVKHISHTTLATLVIPLL